MTSTSATRTRTFVLVTAAWFLLAGYVMWRCFHATDPVTYDILFSCWCGGVASAAVALSLQSLLAGRKHRSR